MKEVKKLNKKFQIFRVIIIVRNHRFFILKLFRVIKGFILYQTKQTGLKSGYKFRSYDKFTDTCRIEELQTRKPLSRIWASGSISRKRQTTGFEPLRHIWIIQPTNWPNLIFASMLVCSAFVMKFNFMAQYELLE